MAIRFFFSFLFLNKEMAKLPFCYLLKEWTKEETKWLNYTQYWLYFTQKPLCKHARMLNDYFTPNACSKV